MRALARRTLYGLAAAAALWAVLCSFLYWSMVQPPDRFGRIVAGIPGPLRIVMMTVPFESMWNVARGGDLAPGDEAPDFCLAEVRPGEAEDPQRQCVRLSSFRGDRPVVLVFGSYT